jgi:GH25 family lysozyme M1 (1,4-beta-N-acetylmuramidase)
VCIKFIDISEHNTILKMSAINNDTIKGVIIKATEGTTYVDHLCDIFYLALKGVNNLGFYHYLTSTSSPITQAQTFYNKIKDKQYQILPVLDVEQDSLGNDAELYSLQFIAEFNRLSGQQMLIYSGRYYIQEHFSDAFKKNHIWWVADYSANDTPKISGCNIVAWQYTDKGNFDFAKGEVDTSILVDGTNFFISKQVEQVPPIIKVVGINVLQTELNNQGLRDKNGNKLIVDGVAGKLTLSACPILKIGAKGNITKWVQGQLNIDNDGIFGENTKQAIIVYQENKSLHGDGIVGQITWSKLLSVKCE